MRTRMRRTENGEGEERDKERESGRRRRGVNDEAQERYSSRRISGASTRKHRMTHKIDTPTGTHTYHSILFVH